MKVNFFRIDFESTIDILRDYQVTMEEQLTHIQKQEVAHIAALLKGIEDEEEAALQEDLAGDEFHCTYEIMFPRYMRYSFIVLLFLNLESLLTRFCDSIKRRNKIAIRSSDLKGDSVARSRTYLHKVAAIPELMAPVWNSIEDLSKVRNCIVHTLGKVELSSDQTRIKDIARQGIGLSIGDNGLEEGCIVLNPQFCIKAVDDVANLIKELFDKAGYGPAVSK
jgi:hypothetical protein